MPPSNQPEGEALRFWDEVSGVIDENPEGIAFVIFKMRHGPDLQIDELQTISLGSDTLTIFHSEGGRTLIEARNIFSVYVSLKE